MLWHTMGIRLAYRKASRGQRITWIGADLQALHQGTRRAQVRATGKQEIVDEIREKTHEHATINVLAKKALLSYVGKLNHLAGIVEFLRPFMADLYGVIHRTTGARAPNNCYWTKQWRHVAQWLAAFFQREKDTILRTYRVDSYFGKGMPRLGLPHNLRLRGGILCRRPEC